MGHLSTVLAFAFLGSAPAVARAQAPIVLAAEGQPDRFTIMNLGAEPILVDFLAMLACEVDHSVIGTIYAIPSLGFYKFHVPPGVAAGSLSFRVHQLACEGIKCAGGATDAIPPSNSVREVVIRDDGGQLRKTVFTASWDAANNVSYAVSCNELAGQAFNFTLSNGALSKTVRVSGFAVDPGSQLIVIGPPPLTSTTDLVPDPTFSPPGVFPEPPAWQSTPTLTTPL